MPAILIAAFVAGLAFTTGTSLFARRYAPKVRFNQPDRELINYKLQMQMLARTLIGVQVLLAVTVAFLVPRVHETNVLISVFVFVLFLCIGPREIFRQLRIAAETELEYRKLHPRANKAEDNRA